MTKIHRAFFYSLLHFLCACSGTECDKLPKNYSSYNEAIKIITAADFQIEETVNTSKSSWVRGASYYSCDGATGFFILKTDNQDYLYSGVPAEIWQGFKNAESFGNFYNHNIKHRYTFNLNQ
jgi:hypothetical protein